MRLRFHILLCLSLLVSSMTRVAFAQDEATNQLRIAGIVLKWIRADREANFARLEPLIRRAAAGGARLVCTTECCLDGYSIDDKSIPLTAFRSLGEPIPEGEYFRRFRSLADELNIYLIVGLLERLDQKVFNSAILLSPQGELLGKYHKQRLEHEAVRVTPGTESTVLSTPFGKFGVMICADRRDEAVVRGFTVQGAELLVCPSGGMFGPEKNDHILQRRSREVGKPIVFVHPAEFLVTDPTGEIAQRVLLGEKLKLDDDEIDTNEDSSGVFFVDMQRTEHGWEVSPLSHALSRQLLPRTCAKNELLKHLSPRVPAFDLPATKEAWIQQATDLRQQFLEKIVLRGAARQWRETSPRVEWLDTLDPDPRYRIRKFRYEAVPGFWIPALLYEPTKISGRVPVMLNPNGHDHEGKATSYKQLRCINLARRGILAYSLEFINMGQLRDNTNNHHNRLVQFDLCGTSGVAPFHFALERALDIALSHEDADPKRVGITGLSGGGWQSIWLASLDPRITCANPVAGYCSIAQRLSEDNNIGDAEQLPSDMCAVLDFTHLTAMVAPRPLLLTYNARDDCCFVPDKVLEPLVAAGRAAYELCGADSDFHIHINQDPGTHNYESDNREAMYRFVQKYLLAPGAEEQLEDLEVSDQELKTADELAVPLPEQNLSLHALALELGQALPRQSAIPEAGAEREAWCQQRRKELRAIVRPVKYTTQAELVDTSMSNELSISYWNLKLNHDWTIPAVVFNPPNADHSCVLIGDWGKQSLTSEVSKRLAEGWQVVAVDILGFGEANPNSSPSDHDDVIISMLATFGERPLGIQTGQLNAVVNWASSLSHGRNLSLVSVGPRTSVVALVAVALEPRSGLDLLLNDSWTSLHEVLRSNLRLEDAPELFCFGLLERFDIPQLSVLAE